MPGDKTGKNLFVCIPPDHMRDDLPTDVTVRRLYGTGDSTFHVDTPVFVGVTDDMGNTVTLPCFDVRYVAGKGIVVMAHRTGRPDKPVVDMPFQTEFFVRWADGLVTKESFWHGLVLDYGPSQTGADLYSDGTIEEIEWPGYRGTKGARWFRTRGEAEARP